MQEKRGKPKRYKKLSVSMYVWVLSLLIISRMITPVHSITYDLSVSLTLQ